MVSVYSLYHHSTDGDPPNIVAVLAFKAAYTLEKKRRENDKRVLALYSEYAVLNLDP